MNTLHFDALDDATQLPSGTIKADYFTVSELIALGYATPRDPENYSLKPQITSKGRIALDAARNA